MEPPSDNLNLEMGPKLHGRAFYEAIGSPRFILAPMVDQSEFAWRMLSRSYLPPAQRSSLLAYTPMLHSRLYADSDKYRAAHFQPTTFFAPPAADAPPAPRKDNRDGKTEEDETIGEPYLDGNRAIDRPLFVQFCSNDPEALIAAARRVAPYCDAVDLNFGCPQGIAKRGRYGAFLQEDQDLVYRLINILHKELPIPVTAKIRILDTREATLAYARNVLAAGASILTVHGRRREQKGHLTGLADWATIRWLREQLPAETVLFANGNVLQHRDLQRCLEETGADGVMSAEGNLSDPSIFATSPSEAEAASEPIRREHWRGRDGLGGWRVDGMMRRYLDILHKYVAGAEPPTRRPLFVPGDDEAWIDEAEQLEKEENENPAPKKQRRGKNPIVGSPNMVAVQGHLFHLLRHLVTRHTDVRDKLGKARQDLDMYEHILHMVETRVARGLVRYEATDGKSLEEEEEELARAAAAKAEAKKAAAEAKASGTNGEDAAAPSGNKRKATDELDDSRAKRAQPPSADTGTGEQDSAAAAATTQTTVEEVSDPDSSVATVNQCKRPWWIAQPIVRPLPQEALAKGSIQISKKERRMVEKEISAATSTKVAASQEQEQEPVATATTVEADSAALAQSDPLVSG